MAQPSARPAPKSPSRPPDDTHKTSERELDRDLEDTFPASDPIPAQQPVTARPERHDDEPQRDKPRTH
ncbi:hypothetical protein [Niveispirillum fermenti]|uniref:hypothetical protein n=1 Tax=Niveispirillum fermenti TaxID=1233113 RepID=UPI003A89F9AC